MIFVEPVFCPQAVLDWCAYGSREKKKDFMESGNVKSGEINLQAKKHLSTVGWKFSYAEKKRKEKIPKKSELQYQGKVFSLSSNGLYRIDGLEGAVLENKKKRRNPPDQDVDIRNPRSILSLLIDNNAVMPTAKLYYTGRKGDRRMKVFQSKPAASFVLEHGRSLLECQKQILNKCEILRSNTHKRVIGGQPQYKSDFICSICHFGGELLLCDGCPSVFHLRCVGIMDLPKGNWFYPSC
ncbi:hypothetical protein NE237_020382 [Protea cynaroides]|uniref:PHD-type domain-containing protein n=1 Tax=Protea cynaroides TaxID=273540 RepID=A0A9Q0H5Y2_9MAGN|nr:hypothetical protein NE237_020382 [Protea cynaroides]